MNKPRVATIVDKAIRARTNMINARSQGNKPLEEAYRNEINEQRKNWINFQKQIGNKFYRVDDFNNAVIRGSKDFEKGTQPRTKYIRKQLEDIRERNIFDYERKGAKPTAETPNPFDEFDE
jgi:hypothetical protein